MSWFKKVYRYLFKRKKPMEVKPSDNPLYKPTKGELNLERLMFAARYATKERCELFLEPLKKAMCDYEINTPLRQQHFLAQLLHESASFRYTEEIASGAAYEGRKDLGNVQKGDGRKFKGRGLIQLTGRYNYTKYSKYEGVDFVEHPAIVKELPYSVRCAAWFWKTHNLNKYADVDNIKKVTKVVNGGLTGYTDRCSYLKRLKMIL